MTWRRLYITVEGQTERKFADEVLQPHLAQFSLDVRTRVVLTNRKLVARLPKQRPLSDDQLREYDGNVVGHWKHITRRRNLHGQTLYPLYFQYLGLLTTEVYLDRYFRDRDTLVASLNVAVDDHNREAAKRDHFALYRADDLNKLAFWMATGSGKTLLMHCHIRQYLHYLGKAGRRQELNRIILLTPNEGLSRQHKEEFELSGIEAEFYDRQGGSLFTGRGVDIIDIHKLRETSGEKTVAVDTFEGNNLVLVDDGASASHPEHIELLETLNIFGIRSDYMKEFEEYLEEEGVGEDERREIVFLPTIKLPEFEQENIQLHVIRAKDEMPDFKKSVRLKLESLEGRLNNKVIADIL